MTVGRPCSKGSCPVNSQFEALRTRKCSPSLDPLGMNVNGEARAERLIERGVSFFDSPHRIVVSAIYRLPFGKGHTLLSHSGFARWAFGGW